jgi:hypothetical protein
VAAVEVIPMQMVVLVRQVEWCSRIRQAVADL